MRTQHQLSQGPARFRPGYGYVRRCEATATSGHLPSIDRPHRPGAEPPYPAELGKQSGAGIIKLLILLFFTGALAAFFLLGGNDWLNLATLEANRDALLQYTASHYWYMLAIVGLIYTLSTALSVPGAVVLSLAVGLLFGRWVGTLLIIVAATAGATLVFLAARYLFADVAKRRMGAAANKIIAGFHANALHYLLFLRLVPVFPFWLVNLVPAFTPIHIRTYVTATAIGIAPGSFVFANLGQSLGRIESTRELMSFELLGGFALLGVFALVPVVVKKMRGDKAMREHPT